SLRILSNSQEVFDLGSFVNATYVKLNATNDNNSYIDNNDIYLDLSIGSYQIELITKGDDNYDSQTINFPLVISNSSQNIIVVNSSYFYEYNTPININISFLGDNTVTSILDSSPEFIVNGTNIVNASLLDPGYYQVNFTTTNDAGYETDFTISVQVKDTALPNISNIDLFSNLSYYINSNRYLFFNSTDGSNINQSTLLIGQRTIFAELNPKENSSVSEINGTNQKYLFNLSILNVSNYVYVINSKDDSGNINTKTGTINISKNNVYNLSFALNGVSASAFTINEDTSFNFIANSTYDAPFDIFLYKTSSTSIATDVTNYSTSYSIADPGDYEIRLIVDDSNYEGGSLNTSLTISDVVESSSSSSSSSSGGGGGGSSNSQAFNKAKAEKEAAEAEMNKECVSAWDCSSWTTCQSSLQSRTCDEVSSCGGSSPSIQRSCTEVSIQEQVLYEEKICEEDYNCDDWSVCSNNIQTRSCSQTTSCDSSSLKPVEQKKCGEIVDAIIGYSDEYDARVVDYGEIDDNTRSAIIEQSDVLLIEYENKDYEISISDAKNDIIIGKIESTGQEIIFKKGISNYIDLDLDGVADVVFSLVGVSGTKLNIKTTTKIEEQTAKEIITDTNFIKNTKNVALFITIILILLIFISIYKFSKDDVGSFVKKTKILLDNKK
ncbi:hypothetical protein HN836_05345, partial [Candidatus Woesearchaeota archaeon]|nr:hypothetical protein [Candidatus Woesearchaeota archaeon]